MCADRKPLALPSPSPSPLATRPRPHPHPCTLETSTKAERYPKVVCETLDLLGLGSLYERTPGGGRIYVPRDNDETIRAEEPRTERFGSKDDVCGICYSAPMVEPFVLPCGHAFCKGCLKLLRAHGEVGKSCPMCRVKLPLSSCEQFYELYAELDVCYSEIQQALGNNRFMWNDLSPLLASIGGEGQHLYGRRVLPALGVLRALADGGNWRAQDVLGDVCYEGRLVPQVLEDAFFWYQKSADQGFGFGEAALGQMYALDEQAEVMGEQERDRQALSWFQRMLKSHNPDYALGTRWLGKFYAAGRGGLETDPEMARTYFKTSAEGGDEEGDHLYHLDRRPSENTYRFDVGTRVLMTIDTGAPTLEQPLVFVKGVIVALHYRHATMALDSFFPYQIRIDDADISFAVPLRYANEDIDEYVRLDTNHPDYELALD